MRIFAISIVLASALTLTGCSHPSRIKQLGTGDQVQLTSERETDNRMSDWNLTSSDAELYIGDLGVEQLYAAASASNRVKSLAAENKKQALLPNGFPLIQAFPSPGIVPKKGGYVENVIETAKSYLGTPYVYGSDRLDPQSFDCSDFTRWVYLTALGMDLPWDAKNQAAYVEALSKRKYTDLKQAKRGDLLFFTNFMGNRPSDYANLDPSQKPISHMGIYLGDGKIIHSASKKTGGVRIDHMFFKHLQYRFVLGGSVLD
ncbi:C40 family peptidase [Paenibacillus sp. CGMCC 1.16610]|uniref:NlpC/P60 family protein n=1 Tax=Paenibacillus anseongense TaxID=2682845 RepID=A0ABW9UB68_9BACL|nr:MULTISPECIES: C40 family peptidase [Paenibacillus]MBA2940458.1 C40 family peptidase [Paenibacillus sp. CGMCC 1.16610]MVQ35635.1 NlpC/P60 family protein [Paenibacillus anseongense]